MEFSKDNNTIQILPGDFKIHNAKNFVSLKPEGNILIQNNDFSYNTWNNYKSIVNKFIPRNKWICRFRNKWWKYIIGKSF